MKRIQKFFIVIFFIFSLCLLVSGGYYLAVTHKIRLQPEKLLLPERTVTFYDYQNKTFKSESELFRQNVVFKDLPKVAVQAFVCTEDKRFFSHDGFDWKRIAKAAYLNTKNRSFSQGASTISQQLIKNTHLTQEKTLKRKAQEWKLTRELEQKYSKEEIFEKYVNAIYFGHNVFGLHGAASFYFNKSPQELDVADCAILAGLVKSPNNYSPFKNAKNCQKRKEIVLKAMLKNEVITPHEYKIAIEKPLPVCPANDKKLYDFSHRVFDELSTLAEERQFQLCGNIQIYTQFHPNLQLEIERIFSKEENSGQTLCVLDANTRCFKGYISTSDNLCRAPASLVKPLLIYAPALEENVISLATPILDEKINFGGYAPNNHNDTFHGYISAREALSQSLNIPAVKILNTLGLKKAAEYGKKMGLEIENDDLSLALALGGMKNGFPFTKLLSAYACLANGNFRPASFIEKVVINNKIVYQKSNVETQVFSKDSTYLLTDALRTCAKEGTAKKLHSLPFPIAAKTGTNGTEKGNTDAYAISYTTRDLVGCWLGNDDYSFIPHVGGGVACNQVFAVNRFLEKEYQTKNITIQDFQKPKNVECVELDKTSYYDTHSLLLADEISPKEYRIKELFKKDTIPSKKCDFFINPRINTPILTYTNGKVIIKFPQNPLSVYQYRIEKNNYITHRLLYQGEYLPEFIDKDVETGKRYVYTITPIFQGHEGTPIILPTLTTNDGNHFSISDKNITDKNWWEY